MLLSFSLALITFYIKYVYLKMTRKNNWLKGIESCVKCFQNVKYVCMANKQAKYKIRNIDIQHNLIYCSEYVPKIT